MIGLDTLTRELERVERLRIAFGGGRVDLGRADAQAGLVEIDPVEFFAVFDQRAVTARDDVGDDGTHGLLDVLRALALNVEKGRKARGKVGALAIEA